MSGKKLGTSIASLLYEHDCVIVPGFGGFIANYKPAHVHPRLKVICPPSKSISFNRQLLRNDGLIANYISEQENISYDAALAYIESTVKQYNTELKEGKRLEIEKVGSLYLDSAERLQFIPDQHTNFLSTSFGLSNMPLVALEKEEEETPVVNLPVAETAAVVSERRNPWWVGAAAVALPIALVSVFSFQNVFNSGNNFEFAHLNPFAHMKKQAEFSIAEHETIEISSSTEASTSWDAALAQHQEANSFEFSFDDETAHQEGVTIRLKEEAPEKELALTNSNLQLYFVIAGAFEMEDNATGLVNDLQKDGFDAAMVGKRGRLHLVAYGAYNSRKAAKKALRDIQSNNLSGWIYKK